MRKTTKSNAVAAPSPTPAVDLIVPRRRAGREFLFMSPMTLWRREHKDPTFPRPVLIGPGRYGYRLSEIRAWLDSRPRVEPEAPKHSTRNMRERNGRRGS